MTENRKYNSKGQLIEELDIRDLFMSPKPVSPKRIPLVSTQGKRQFQDAFKSDTFDDDRYGQHISCDFFKTKVSSDYEERKTFTSLQEKEILEWCEYYLANKKKSNNIEL
jgi:hypothetical protein